MVISSKRLKVKLPALVAVEITGEGSIYNNEVENGVTIHGDTYTAAAAGISVQPGDTITFSVWGYTGNTDIIGTVTIDGATVLSVTSRAVETYEWTVPEGIAAIAINLATHMSPYGYSGHITVTTA